MKNIDPSRIVRCITLIASLTTAALYLTAPAARAALPDKTLVYCSEGSPAGLDPGLYTTSVEFSASAETVYNRLVEFERGGTNIEPGLAKRWDVSADGRVYTFYLRRGVKFHTTKFFKPTRNFNADDVIFTFERMRNPQLPFRRAYPTEFPYFVDMGLDKAIQKIEALGPYKVRFTLESVNAPFLQNLAMPFASILSAEYAAQLLRRGRAADINWRPIGTGPFIFRSYTKDAALRFAGNPSYWKPADVQLSGLVFAITPDPAIRLQKFKRNECQVMSFPRPADLDTLRADPNLRLLSQPAFNLAYLAYNVTHKPLDNVLVRRALDMAINKKTIIDAVYSGMAQPAHAPMPPTQWSYNKRLKSAPYNPRRARALLRQAGYPEGFAISLWAMPVQRPYNPNARLMAEMIQADWAKIGVKAEIVSYEWGEYTKRARNGEHDTLLIGWNGDNGDPDNWLGAQLSCDASGNNFSKWCNKRFSALIQKARRTTAIDQRTAFYAEAQRIFSRELPFSPLAHSTVYQPISKNVTGFTIDPLGLIRFDGVGLK